MDFNTRSKWPYREASYVPYFYQPGLFHYLPQKKNVQVDLNYGSSVEYDFSSDITQKITFPKPPTVEQIIAHGYFALPKSDPVAAVISDKKDTTWMGLDDVISQIRQRYQVYHKNLYDLELSKCAVINSLYEHQAWHGPTTSKVEYSVNKRLDGLYAQQREERINLWRDVSRLRQSLPETAQNYLAAYRKVSILKNTKGDSP